MTNDGVIRGGSAYDAWIKANGDSVWRCELLGGNRDGTQFHISRVDHPHFPPEVWETVEPTRVSMHEYAPFARPDNRVRYRMKWVRSKDGVFVYERIKP